MERSETTRDDLFTPTLGDRGTPPEAAEKPWQLSSQVFVAFFGGAPAVTGIAYVNARRLGLSEGRLRALIAVGVLGFAAAVAFAALAASAMDGRGVRLGAQVISVLAYGGLYLIQREADRRHHFFYRGEGEPYESMWGPGFLAVFTLGVLNWLAIATAVAAGD